MPRRTAGDKRSRPADGLGPLIFRGRKRLWQAAERALEEQGESVHVYQVLAALCRGKAGTQRGLADATAQHPAGVSRLLEQLEREGLVTRRRAASDRRAFDVRPTARARRRVAAARPVITTAMQAVLAPLSRVEQRTLARLLRKIVD